MDSCTNSMIRIVTRYIRKTLLVLSITMLPVVKATADLAGLIPASPPITMARFYVVDSDGRSASDKNIPTQTQTQDHRSSEPRRKKSDHWNRNVASKARKNSDSRESIRLRSNGTKAWQCERHGFFFTADGRCVQPVIPRKKITPPTISRRPFRGNMRSK